VGASKRRGGHSGPSEGMAALASALDLAGALKTDDEHATNQFFTFIANGRTVVPRCVSGDGPGEVE
jgi:hypothetical protein